MTTTKTQVNCEIDERLYRKMDQATSLFGTRRSVIEAALLGFLRLSQEDQLAAVAARSDFLASSETIAAN